jgi:hypothetical protein
LNIARNGYEKIIEEPVEVAAPKGKAKKARKKAKPKERPACRPPPMTTDPSACTT